MKLNSLIFFLLGLIIFEDLKGQTIKNCPEIIVQYNELNDSILSEFQSYKPFIIDKNQAIKLSSFQTLVVPTDIDLITEEMALRDSIRTLFTSKKPMFIIDGIHIESSISISHVVSILRIFVSELQKNNCLSNCKALILIPDFRNSFPPIQENPTKAVIKINKKEDVYFENQLVTFKDLDKKLKEFDWQNDRSIIISAEVGTQFSIVTKVMGICNKNKLRTVLATK
jgi:biopolymer transport protein ExbD